MNIRYHPSMDDSISVSDALLAFAFMGDLSMGQPPTHSRRVAWLARRIAQDLGLEAGIGEEAEQVALLRWAGCTANASDVAGVIADDVQGRRAMLALRPQEMQVIVAPEDLAQQAPHIAAVHCEVASLIVSALGLSPSINIAMDFLFEKWNGSGVPGRLAGNEIPLPVLIVHLAGDCELLAREHGLPQAAALIAQRAEVVYPRAFAELACASLQAWLQELDAAPLPIPLAQSRKVPLSLLADAIDLKLPWLTGFSRACANTAGELAARLQLPQEEQALVRRSALLHSLGRVAIPNKVWNREGPLSSSDWEQVRLGPYWTARLANLVPALKNEAEMASYAYERLDGSGYFRAASGAATGSALCILPVANCWIALQSPRPWRAPMQPEEARAHMEKQMALGRFDAAVVAALDGRSAALAAPSKTTHSVQLSAREREVLQRISKGESNKEAARQLGLSPATVRTHLESVFRKLECNSRAAATLKASLMGLL
ncbi:HD domain-containing phosphohydrolase [Massilia endophytica]|uniref:HD domain-containing phosphohydrolase n=1 Tax=Massilia endophytica TaxID=2899220 RepID=UPI001E4CD52B|nr:HD domain-containing phosphohydrolase [Massilia endophytica]UGQ46659.1 LuxR C-terminal-related transcriptional regulator [Massilia endophytica]